MADTEDTVRPSASESEGKSIGKISRSYLLVLCFTLIINKGFLFVDALEHRGELLFAQPAECISWSSATKHDKDIFPIVYSNSMEFIYFFFFVACSRSLHRREMSLGCTTWNETNV